MLGNICYVFLMHFPLKHAFFTFLRGWEPLALKRLFGGVKV